MLSDSIQSKLDDLSSLMSTTAVTSSLDTWRDIAQLATDLADCLLREGDSAAHDLALLLARVAVTLSKGIIANPEAGVKAGKSILAVLMDLNSPGGIVESHRKQAHAEAMLFFRDAQKEELLVQEATTFGDDEEQREMIMAIEQRIDELEAELLGLNPPSPTPMRCVPFFASSIP